MIIVENEQEVSNLVNSFDCHIGTVKLSLESFEASSIQHDEFYVVSKDVIEQSLQVTKEANELFLKLQRCLAIIVVGEICEKLLGKFSNIISFIDEKTSKKIILNNLIFLNDVILEKEILKSQLIGLNQELSEAMGTLELELLKVKKFSEQKSFRRFEDIKGAKLYSKYCAGESSGGEFFDLFKNENLIFIMMSSTSSYLASSSILSIFSEIKKKGEISSSVHQQFLSKIDDEIAKINQGKNKKIRCNVFSVVIDLSTFKVYGNIFGEYKILSSNVANSFNGNKEEISSQSNIESNIESNTETNNRVSFERALSRGERLLLASPGLVQNWDNINPGFMIEELLVRNDIRAVDILDEVFFQIKKDSESGFLSTDAAAILLEVDKNVMLKV